MLDVYELACSWLPLLIRLYWILATGSVLLTLTPLPVPQSFKDAVRLSAARGKLWSCKPQALGPLADVSVPQSWFAHFYALGAAVNLVLLLALWGDEGAGKQVLVLLLLQLHLCRRLLETLFVMVYPKHARMHVIAWLFGLSYYKLVPLSLLNSSRLAGLKDRVAAVMRAAPHSWWIASSEQGGWGLPGVRCFVVLQQALSHASPMLLMGVCVFLIGNALQCWAHVALGKLAAGRQGTAGSTHTHNATEQSCTARTVSTTGDVGTAERRSGLRQRHAAQQHGAAATATDAAVAEHTAATSFYTIPQGGMFDLVSCPHYLGEVVVYCGLVLLSEGQANSLLMLAWVVVNLVLAAGATQKWYHDTFPDYPKKRKALVPFVW